MDRRASTRSTVATPPEVSPPNLSQTWGRLQNLPILPAGEYRFEVRTWSDRFVGTILTPWMNHLLPARLLRWIIEGSGSPVLRETFRCPGGWSSTYLAYQNAPPVDWIDRIVLNDPIARSLRNRRQVVTQKLSEFILEFASREPVVLLGIGAGPGAQFHDAILRSGLSPEAIEAHVVDLHDDAFPFGRARAAQLGISDVMHYTCGDARNISEVLPDVRPHIVKLIGLIEYLDDDQVLALLKAAHHVMAPEGVLLTNSFVDCYRGAPFLVRVLGLKHVYRTPEQVIDLLREAGFSVPPNRFDTPMQMYSVMWTVKSR